MLQEVVMSPMGRTGESLYDKMNFLSNEITEGIVNISNGKRWLVDTELQRLKDEAQREVSPEATYNILLFRKYAGIANQIKDEITELRVNGSAFANILPESGNDESLLRGWDALKSNLFWLRALAAMFSFISFVVMSTVPYVDTAEYHPSKHFSHSNCYTQLGGYFSMRPYEFVIVVGVLIYLHTLVTSLYYILPVDEQEEKYIPGLKSCIFTCLGGSEDEAMEVLNSVYNSFRTVARLLEFLVDLALVILALVAFLLAAIMLDTPARFHTYEGSVYFSLPSFYLTYSGMSCLEYEDPTPKIRASLAMLFFALCVMGLCLQVSLRNVRKEVTHRSAPSGLGRSDIGSRGIQTGDGREAFLSAPLPTSSDHYGSDGSADEEDEEVAVTFHHRAAEESKRAASPAQAPLSTSASAPASASKGYLDRQKEKYASPNKATAGVGRGAALMRRYEGNQGNRESSASSPPRAAQVQANAEAGAVEEGYGNLPRDQQSDSEYEEADL